MIANIAVTQRRYKICIYTLSKLVPVAQCCRQQFLCCTFLLQTKLIGLIYSDFSSHSAFQSAFNLPELGRDIVYNSSIRNIISLYPFIQVPKRHPVPKQPPVQLHRLEPSQANKFQSDGHHPNHSQETSGVKVCLDSSFRNL